jgi:glyoxylase-like metal-dependent hydrolase (beta-lactamase superfamily II)
MPQLSRRRFITTFTKGTASIAVLGVAACSSESVDGTALTTSTMSSGTSTTASAPPPSTTTEAPTTTEAGTTTAPGDDNAFAWERVDLGNVSAYILERSGEAVLIDTGNGGSAGDIEAALGRLGLAWGNLGHVILTHRHGAHVGSADPVMAAAPEASGHIREGDAPAVSASRPRRLRVRPRDNRHTGPHPGKHQRL